MLLVAAGSVSVAASPAPSAPPAPIVEPLAGSPATEADPRIDLVRITLPPGAVIGPIAQLGTSVSRVESGSIVVRVDRGIVLTDEDTLATGDEVTVRPGGTVVEGPGAVMTWRNDGEVETIVLTSRMVHETPIVPASSPIPGRQMTEQFNVLRFRAGHPAR